MFMISLGQGWGFLLQFQGKNYQPAGTYFFVFCWGEGVSAGPPLRETSPPEGIGVLSAAFPQPAPFPTPEDPCTQHHTFFVLLYGLERGRGRKMVIPWYGVGWQQYSVQLVRSPPALRLKTFLVALTPFPQRPSG